MLNLKKTMNSRGGVILFSVILGIGLSCIFKMSCDSNNCLIHKGPDFKEKNMIKYNNKCYKPTENIETCDTNKKIISL